MATSSSRSVGAARDAAPGAAGERPAADHRTAFERWELPNLDPGAGVRVKELDTLQRQAYEEGYAGGREAGHADGYRNGYAAGEAAVREAAERLRAVLATLARPLEQLDEEIEAALVALAVSVARQLVRRELRTDPGQVVGALREAASALPSGQREVRVVLHPEDARLVREALAVDGQDAAWRLQEDPVMTRGGCRVETDTSRVDATVEGRLAAVVAHVLGGERGSDEAPVGEGG